jgi:AraC family transcriptional regulator of arabinose operon
MLWFHFVPRPHVMSLLDWPEKIKGLASIQLEGAVFESAQRELQEAHLLEKHHLKGWFPLACSLLETTLIRGCYHLLNQESKNIKSILNIQKLLQESKINIDEIAKRCGVSRASLYKKFKDATGISPQQYRESLALQEAMHLLESTTMPIAQVAEEAGFSDPFYFSTRFRKYYGISPRKHRGNRDSNISKPPAAFGVNKNSKNL